MKNKKKILFLGYDKKETKIINFLITKKYKVIELGQKKIFAKNIGKYDRIIIFGYRKIIAKNIIKKLIFPPINLHISFLPYNKGSHPNYWSFVDGTPKGITIHEVDNGIDTGKIILQKKINLILNKKTTFYSTYQILFQEIEKLFIKNYKLLLESNYKKKSQKKRGTFHLKKDLPCDVDWNISILDYLDQLKKH